MLTLIIMPSSTKLSPIQLLVEELQSYQEDQIPSELMKEIEVVVSKTREDMSKKAAKFLHTQLDEKKHNDDQVKAIIDAFPAALFYEDSIGTLPVQRAACQNNDGRSAVSFIPLLAKEGEELLVGGEGKRGGLLCDLPGNEDGANVLQLLATSVDQTEFEEDSDAKSVVKRAQVMERLHAEAEFDTKRMEILEELRDMDLMFRDDVLELNLLQFSSSTRCEQRFQFFVEWCPHALKETEIKGEPLLHTAIRNKDPVECFEMVLRTSMNYFPDELGFLYREYKGQPALEAAIAKIGEYETMSIIRRCIPRAPKLMQSVAKFTPEAAYLKDSTNRPLRAHMKKFDGHF